MFLLALGKILRLQIVKFLIALPWFLLQIMQILLEFTHGMFFAMLSIIATNSLVAITSTLEYYTHCEPAEQRRDE